MVTYDAYDKILFSNDAFGQHFASSTRFDDENDLGEVMDLENKFVAIKMHLGEPGNLAFLRPAYAKVVADVVREAGGKPFLTDCNTLYVGGRKNAVDHLDAAFENGFNPLTCGCQVIIADGLKGTDDVEVVVPGGEYVTRAKVGRAIMDAKTSDGKELGYVNDAEYEEKTGKVTKFLIGDGGMGRQIGKMGKMFGSFKDEFDKASK